MTIYLVMEYFPYEGTEVLKVFSDFDKAHSYKHDLLAKVSKHERRHLSVEEWEVEE